MNRLLRSGTAMKPRLTMVLSALVFRRGALALSLCVAGVATSGYAVVAIADTFKIPVRLIGVGEAVDDLQDFDAKAFVDALF